MLARIRRAVKNVVAPVARRPNKEREMKRTIQWIAAVVAIGVFAVASAGSETPRAPVTPDPAAETTPATPVMDEVVELSAGVETETTYYSDASKTVQVGFCIQRTCHPKGRTCSGQVTIHKTIIQGPC
jgi:hypothetical protein